MPPGGQHLVKDRLPDFQCTAMSKNTLMAPTLLRCGTGSTVASAADLTPKGQCTPKDAQGKSVFMREFFESVGEIQTSLGHGRSNVKRMAEVLEEALQATTRDRRRAFSDRLQDLVPETNGHLARAKESLERLKARSDEEDMKKPNSAEGKIRVNMQQAMAKKHQQLLLDFHTAQVDVKAALERRQAREMEILMPDATPEERAAMVEAGETAQLMVARTMAGAHALLLDEIQRAREERRDVLRLERSIADLAQMFTEMASLVEAQGEMLDAIEAHVHRAAGCTAEAETERIKTRRTQRNTQEWMCCGMVFLTIALISVIGPVLVSSG